MLAEVVAVASVWGGGGQPLLLLLPGAERGWLREEEPAQSAQGRHPGVQTSRPGRVARGPGGGGVVLGREAGVCIYLFTVC